MESKNSISVDLTGEVVLVDMSLCCVLQAQFTMSWMLMKTDGCFCCFDDEIKQKYECLDKEEKRHWSFFASPFKASRQYIKKDYLIVRDDVGKEIPAKRVFANAIRYIKEQSLQQIRHSGRNSSLKGFFWKFTLPSDWSDLAMQTLEEAVDTTEIPRYLMSVERKGRNSSYTNAVSDQALNNVSKADEGMRDFYLDRVSDKLSIQANISDKSQSFLSTDGNCKTENSEVVTESSKETFSKFDWLYKSVETFDEHKSDTRDGMAFHETMRTCSLEEETRKFGMAVLDCKEKKTASVDSKIEFKVSDDESKIQNDERETEYDSGSDIENECEADANNGKWDCDSDAYVSEEEIPQPNYPVCVTCIKDKELPSEKCRSPNNMQIQHASPDLADFEQYGVEKKKQSTKSEVNDMQQELLENRTCITSDCAKDHDAGSGGKVQQNDGLWKFSSEDKAEGGVNIEPCEGIFFASERHFRRMQERTDANMFLERMLEVEISLCALDFLHYLVECGILSTTDLLVIRTDLRKTHPVLELVENLYRKDAISKQMEEEENSIWSLFPNIHYPSENPHNLNELILQEVMRRGKSTYEKFKTYLEQTGQNFLFQYISDMEGRFCYIELDNYLKRIQDDPQKFKRGKQTVVTENRWVRFEGEPLTKVQQTKKIRQLSLPGRGQGDGDSIGNPVPQDVEWGQLKQEEAKSCSLSSAISRQCISSNANKNRFQYGIFMPLVIFLCFVSSASATNLDGISLCMNRSSWNEDCGVSVFFNLKKNDSGHVTVEDGWSKTETSETVRSHLLFAFLILNTLALALGTILLFELKKWRYRKQHDRQMVTSETENGVLVPHKELDAISGAEKTKCHGNKCENYQKSLGDGKGNYLNRTNEPDKNEKPLSMKPWIFVIFSLVVLYIWIYCLCFFLQASSKKQKENITVTSDLMVTNLVTTICFTFEVVPLIKLEKALSVLTKLETKPECFMLTESYIDENIVRLLQQAQSAHMLGQTKPKQDILEKFTAEYKVYITTAEIEVWESCLTPNEWYKPEIWERPPADAKVKNKPRDDETDLPKETSETEPSGNIGSCVLETFQFIRSLFECSPDEELQSGHKTQSDSSKMGMITPDFVPLFLCGMIFLVMTKINIGFGHIWRKESHYSAKLAICDKPHNEDNIESSHMTMKLVEEKAEDDLWSSTNIKDLHRNIEEQNAYASKCFIKPEIIDLIIQQLDLQCPGIPGVQNKSEKYVTTNEGCCQIGSSTLCYLEILKNDEELLSEETKTIAKNETSDKNETIHTSNSRERDEALGSADVLKQKLIEKGFKIYMMYQEETWDWTQSRMRKETEYVQQLFFQTKRPKMEKSDDTIYNLDENVRKRKVLGDGSEEIISVTKQPKWTPFSCGLNVKRKKITEDDKTMKRRRIGGVISRPLDGDFDYCDLIQAFSLHTKRHINSALVNFLCDLLFLSRKYSIGRMMKTSFYTFTDDDMDDIKEVFVQQECFLTEASKSVHKGELLDYVGEDAEYALPGIDYEIHLPLMEKSLDENITKKSLSNDTMLIKKANQQDEEEHILDISEPYRAGLAFKIEVLNEEVSQTLEDDRPDAEEQTSAKLVNAAAASEQLEQVNFEKCDNVGEKVTKIQMQVFSSNFASQSDVSSVSAESLQEALNSTMNAQETFRNLKYKVHNPIPQKEVPEKVDNFGRGKNMKKFLLPEDREEAVYEDLVRNLPQPIIDTALLKTMAYFVFEPIMVIIDQIANGTPPTPHISMRYELLRFCTLRSYPKGDKPYLIKLAEAGFYYASDGDGVVCYCCGTRRYNWTAEDNPWKIHERINPNCKFLRKNDEVNVPVKYFGPFSKSLMYIMSIPEPIERAQVSEDVNNDWAPERTRSPAPQQNRPNESSANALGINTALPKHTQYATKTAREASFNAWPDTASHTPEVLADAGFFYAGFGDCVRCFYCGIGLRHWTQDDDPWIEHARWSKNCVFVKQKKGEEFVNLVQLAIQYSNDNEAGQPAAGAGNQLPVQEIERILLSDAAQSVLQMGYQPRIIKKAIEQILRQNGNAKITAQVLMEKVLEMEEAENPPQAAPVPTVEASAKAKPASQTAVSEVEKAGEAKSDTEKKPNENAKSSLQSKDKDKNEKASHLTSKESSDEASAEDPKAIKAENEQLKEQTLCKVCLDNTVCIVFLPCGHLVTCADCAPAMRKCPICRALVKGTVRTYMS